MYPKTYDSLPYTQHCKRERQLSEEAFICQYCHAWVYTSPRISGVQNRNHCPYCLWSRHVDHFRAGDRMSACKAIMQPIGLTVKQGRNKYGAVINGELMLIHRCNECGKLSINRIAADDLAEQLMQIFTASPKLDERIQAQLCSNGIHLLEQEDQLIVVSQLQGISPN